LSLAADTALRMPVIAIRRTAIAVTSAAVIAAAVAGCGAGSETSASSSSAVATVPSSALARAADVSGAAKGYAFTMSMDETVPGAGTITIGGTGTYSRGSRSGAFTMTMQGGGQSLQMQELVVGTTIYMKMPASLAQKLPGGKPWWEMNLSELGKSTYLSKVSSLMNSSSESSPTMYLAYLKADSSSLQDLGQATVDGVSTTHYQATLNLDKAEMHYPGANRAAVRAMLRQTPGKILDETDMPVDVWIDGSNLVRQVTMKMWLVPKGSSTVINATITMNFQSYGPQATPTAPPADQTLDVLALLKSEGKLSQLGG
jgi:hypothetical protein